MVYNDITVYTFLIKQWHCPQCDYLQNIKLMSVKLGDVISCVNCETKYIVGGIIDYEKTHTD